MTMLYNLTDHEATVLALLPGTEPAMWQGQTVIDLHIHGYVNKGFVFILTDKGRKALAAHRVQKQPLIENLETYGLTQQVTWPEPNQDVLFISENGAKLHIVEGQAANLFIAPRASAGYEWKLVKKGWFIPLLECFQLKIKR